MCQSEGEKSLQCYYYNIDNLISGGGGGQFGCCRCKNEQTNLLKAYVYGESGSRWLDPCLYSEGDT